MRSRQQFSDKRVKRKVFPVWTFLLAFVVFGLFTTLQMRIIGEVIDYKSLPGHSTVLIFMVWFMAAAMFTLITNYQINTHYQKPIEDFSEAAHKVASGDFSVYLPPHHTSDKYTHLDVLFTDFNKMVEELGSIETLKTDFFANVSHEIKTPISVIQNHAYLLQRAELTDEQREEYTETIIAAGKKLNDLITNMLKLNKLEKQAISPAAEAYDLCRQLCQSALLMEDIWEKKNIEFEVDIEDERYITADEGLMELVWSNLLSNALKFTPEGGKVLLRQVLEGDKVKVSVQDTGCGMDEDTCRRIFDKFYQGDTSHAAEGNGLGLALVKRIVELSDGEIDVTSEEGKGSVFTVILPAETSGKER